MDPRIRQTKVCSQCGLPASGNYCSNCGESLELEKESVSGELRSKATSPITSTLSFTKTVWLIWFSPVIFLRSYFTGKPPLTELPFPLSSLWKAAIRGQQKVTRPFHCLAIVIILGTTLGSLERDAWGVNNIGERMFGLSMSDAKEQSEAQLKAYYESTYGRTLHFIDSAHLTGIGTIDKPLDEILGLLNYVYFALIAAAVVAGGSVKRFQAVHSYVYITSAAIAASAVFSALGLAVFSFGASADSIAILALSGFGDLAGYLLIIYFVAILPIVALPRVLQVSTSRVVLATGVACIAWLAGRFVFFSVLQWQFGFIWR